MEASADSPLSRDADRPRIGDGRLWIMVGYGFMAGLPLPLSGFTLRMWLSESGISLGAIGLSVVISLAYSLKFLWSPLLDQVPPPVRLGRRRGWLMAIQPALALCAVALALSDPAAAPVATVAAAACVAFLSASQDIVVDAWRIEVFPLRLQGAALAGYVWGYRGALLISGAGAIKAADFVGWHGALLMVAALLALAPLLTLAAPEPSPPGAGNLPPWPIGARFSLAGRLHHAVIEPLLDFWRRPGAPLILAFIPLFKLGEAMAGIMTAPFYRSLGFDRGAIALATGVPSMAATMAGIALGALLVARWGVARALIATGVIQTAAMAMYVVLAYSAADRTALIGTVVVEAFAQGMADAAFITYLSSLCSRAFTATQYALFSSLAAIGVHTVGSLSGFLAEAVGWKNFYVLTLFAALPAMAIMLVILRRWPPAAHAP